MSPGSISSSAQAHEAAAPPRREETQSVRERAAEEDANKRVKSEAGEGRGSNIDVSA